MNSTTKMLLSVLVTALVVGFGTYFIINNRSNSNKTTDTRTTDSTVQVSSKNGNEDLASLEKNDGFNLKEINGYMLADIKSVFSDAKLISVGESPDHSVTDSNYPTFGQKAVLVYSVSKTITDSDFAKISAAIASQKVNGSPASVRYEINNPSNKGSLMFHEAGGSNIRLVMIPDLNDSGISNITVLVY